MEQICPRLMSKILNKQIRKDKIAESANKDGIDDSGMSIKPVMYSSHERFAKMLKSHAPITPVRTYSNNQK